MQENIRSHLLRITDKCNENCSFCNVTEDTEPNFREKSLVSLLQEVQGIIKKKGDVENLKISISGGEPTLRIDLDKIVLGIKKLGIKNIEIQTNATLLNEKLVNKLVANGVNKFFISFHNHNKEDFEKYVGLKKIFEIVVSNIKNLSKYEDIEVILNPVISNKNYKNLDKYFDYIHKEFPFVKYISLSFVQPHGKAIFDKELFVSYDEINRELNGILDYGFNKGFIINNPYCGLPVCVLNWDKYNKYCVEIIENRINIKNWNKKTDTNKIYTKKCEKCIYKGLCNGVWKEYFEQFKDKGINPINNY